MALRLGRFFENGADWDNYEVESVPIANLEIRKGNGYRLVNRTDFPRVVASLVDHEQLIRVWQFGGFKTDLWITSASLNGGEERLLGRLPETTPLFGFQEIPSGRLAVLSNVVYIAANDGLLEVRDGIVAQIGQDRGLGVKGVLSVTSMGDALFLGLSDGGLIQWNPETGTQETIASSRSFAQRHALDGGAPYVIPAMQPDDRRHCLWFIASPGVIKPIPSVTAPLGGVPRISDPIIHGSRCGIWRYFPQSKRMEQVTRDGVAMDRMEWVQGRLVTLELNGAVGTALYSTDADTLVRTTLINPMHSNYMGFSRGFAIYYSGTERFPLWPCALIGDHLIVKSEYAGYLQLLRPGSLPSPLSQQPVKEVVSLHQLGNNTVLAVTIPGDVWRIRLKPQVGPKSTVSSFVASRTTSQGKDAPWPLVIRPSLVGSNMAIQSKPILTGRAPAIAQTPSRSAPPVVVPYAFQERIRNIHTAMADYQAVFRGSCIGCHSEPAKGKQGKDLYAAVCGICHDANQRASMVPGLGKSEQASNPAYWRTWITFGKPGSLMPAFSQPLGGPLDNKQIESLCAFLATERVNRSTELKTP